MSKTIMILIVLGVMGVLLIGTLVGMFVTYNNRYVELKNLMLTKIEDNKNEYDNMWKKIKQTASVPEKERESLKQLFVEYAGARKPDGQQLMTWIKEAVPSADSSLFKNLMNIITSSRDSWTMRQKELIDMKREMDNLLQKIPSCWFLFGKQTIEITIVTSTRTDKAFESGKDDDVAVF